MRYPTDPEPALVATSAQLHPLRSAHAKLALLSLAHRGTSEWSNEEGRELERYHAKSSTCGPEGVRVGAASSRPAPV